MELVQNWSCFIYNVNQIVYNYNKFSKIILKIHLMIFKRQKSAKRFVWILVFEWWSCTLWKIWKLWSCNYTWSSKTSQIFLYTKHPSSKLHWKIWIAIWWNNRYIFNGKYLLVFQKYLQIWVNDHLSHFQFSIFIIKTIKQQLSIMIRKFVPLGPSIYADLLFCICFCFHF